MKNITIILMLFGIAWAILYAVAGNGFRERINVRFVTAFVAVIIAGFYSPGIPVFFLLIFLIFLVSVSGRVSALCQYIFLSGLVVPISYGVSIGGHFLGFINSLVALGVGAYISTRVSGGPAPAHLRVFTKEDAIVLTTFLIMTVGSYGFVDVYSFCRDTSAQLFLIVVPYIVFRYCIRSERDYLNLVACFGASAFFLSIFALYESHYGWPIFEGINRHLGTGEVSKSILRRGNSLRASATMSGPLPLACYLTVGIIALACSRSFFKSRLGFYVVMVIAVLGLLAAQSRGSLPALAAAFVTLFVARRRFGVAIAMCVAAIVAGLSLYAMAHVSPTLAAFFNMDKATQYGAHYDYRQLLFQRGIEEALKHPLTGMRLQPVLNALSDIEQGQHIVDLVNIYLVIFLVSGLLGSIPFVVLLGMSLFGAFVGFKGVWDREILEVRAFSLAAMVALLIQFSFMSFIDRIPMNFVMILAGLRLVRIERSRLSGSKGAPHGETIATSGLPGRMTARALADRLASRSG
jgi:hypothetical protein